MRISTEVATELKEFIDSSHLLLDVFNQANQGIIIMDTNFRYLYWNSFISKITGFSFEDVKYKQPEELFPFLKHTNVLENLQKVLNKGIKCDTEFEFSLQDKKYHLLHHSNPIKNKNGKIIGVFTIITDITEQKENEIKLNASKERYKLAVKGSRDGLWDWDIKNKKVFFSETWKNQLGYSGNEVEGTLDAWSSLLHPDDKKATLDYLQNYFDKKIEVYSNEFRMKHKNGSYKWIRARGVVLRDIDGQPIRMAGSHTDITEEKEREAIINKTNEEFKKLTEQVPGFLYQFQMFPDGRSCFPYASQQMKEIYELSPKEVLKDASKILPRIHEDDLNRVGTSINFSFENLTRWEITYRVVLPKRGLRWLSARSTPVKQKDGSVIWYGYKHDITEKHIADLKLKETQERWQFAIEGSKDGVWDWNIKTNEIYYSDQWKQMFGYNPDEIDNTLEEWSSRVHPEDIEKAEKSLYDHLAGKSSSYANEHRIQCKDGSYKWIYDRGKVISYDINGNPLRMIGTKTDIHKHMVLEHKLRKLNENKNQFISILGHDLKGPLSSSIGLLNHLINNVEEKDNKTILKEAGLVLNATKQTYNLLEDILAWSRVNTNQIVFNPINLNAKKILEDKEKKYSFLATSKNISFQLGDVVDIDFLADENMIKTVFRNLISNAIKFTKPGGKVELGAYKENKNIVFYVKDNGIGIKKELKDKLFTSDKLISIPGTANEKGTGLGLLLVKGILDRHEGNIWVESEIGKGSTFKFSLLL